MRDRRRAMCCFSGLSILLLGAGCDRNSNVGNRKDALVDSRRDGALPADALVDGRGADRAQGVGWAVSAGGSREDRAHEMVIDGSGNIIIAGNLGQTAQFGTISVTSVGWGGPFVAKLDPTGKFLWAVPLEGVVNAVEGWNGLAVDSAGSIFFVAHFTGTATYGSTTLVSKGDQDVFLAKLSGVGKLLWAKAVVAGADCDQALSLAYGSNGQLTLGGSFRGTTSVGGTSLTAKGRSDLFVARLDGDGNLVWVSQAGSVDPETDDGVDRVIVDTAGNAFAGGWAGPNAAFGALNHAGTPDIHAAYLAKLDPVGKFVWVAALPGQTSSHALQLDAAGNIFVATVYKVPWGGIAEAGQATISKVSPDGGVLWSKAIPGDGTTWVNGLVVAPSGSVTVGGVFSGTVALFGTTVLQSKNADPSYGTGFLARLDPAGKFVHAEQLDGTERGVSILELARDSSANLYATGCFGGVARFGGTTLTSTSLGLGLMDIFVWNKGPEPY